MSSPPQDETPRKRLARLMDERRADLGDLYLHEVAEAAGLTREGLRKIRRGKGAIQTESKLGLERALRWERGSINAILAGGDPTSVQSTDEPKPPPREPSVEELAELTRRLAFKNEQLEAKNEKIEADLTEVKEQLRRYLGEQRDAR